MQSIVSYKLPKAVELLVVLPNAAETRRLCSLYATIRMVSTVRIVADPKIQPTRTGVSASFLPLGLSRHILGDAQQTN